MRLRLLSCTLLLATTVACNSTRETAPEPARAPVPQESPRKYLLEQVDDAAVVQLYADGFAALPLREKTLVWHLYQAALAGRDIFFDQQHRHALEMRGVLEQIVAHPQGIDAATLAEIQRYTKLFWINNGPYNNLTARKFVLKLTPEAFAAAAKSAASAGRDVHDAAGESLDAMLDAASADVLRPERRPDRHQQDTAARARTSSPPAPTTSTPASTMADLQGLHREIRAQLAAGESERQARRGGLQVDGRYGKQISDVVSHLEAAIPFATEPMANALRALIQWYRTGETPTARSTTSRGCRTRRRRSTPSTASSRSISTRAASRGSWEALVFYVNQEKTERIKTLADNAQWFEDHMPWDPKYRKPNVTGIIANAIDVVVETGDSGPVTPVGINLPNDQAHPRTVRQQVGVAVERQRGVRQVRAAIDARRVRVDARRGGARREVRHARRRADHRHARSDRPRVGPAGARLEGDAAAADQGALLGARGRPRRSRRPVLPRRPEAGRARHHPRRRPGRHRPRRVRGATRATRWCSCGACARARRSKKTTCATGR